MADVEERTVHGLRVRIDRTVCVGFAECVHAAPEAFRVGDDDVVTFVAPDHVPREQLLRACAACPVDALSVIDENGTLLVP